MSFKNIGKEPINFKDNEKCLMNKKFKTKNIGNKNKVGILIYDKFKKKSLYGKINVIIICKKGSNYQIKIGKDYEDMNLHKDDLYIVDYKLLNKCSENLWMNFIEKDKKNKKDLLIEDILNSEESIKEEELDFINKNKDEFK